MIPWELLDKAVVPGGGGELRLYRRGEEFSIRADGQELMNSRSHDSEEQLAELVSGKLGGRKSPRVLIGGLGMGYTLATALRELDGGARLDVAELVPAVVKWNRGPLAALAGKPLADRRVTVFEQDVARLLRKEKDAFDAIILDVDNGPAGLTRQENNWLYVRAGLQAIRGALKPRGIFALWSAAPDKTFARRLHQNDFEVEELFIRGRRGFKGGHHVVWLAIRPS